MRPFNPGDLRHRVEVQSLQTTEDTGGDIVQAWISLATIWASVEPLSGRELIEAQSMQSSVSVRIRIRPLDGIDPACRILFRGNPYNIHAILPDPISGLDWLTLLCGTGSSPG